ncbi:helix-turn-helix domain-containing protein [Pseudoalteromonas sp. T1lg65]|uniref:helix-turn-helix domain-containing protein n=1 Tax=Pseudoalteromonas sp. T1lg65 TaxID=2077101 RepID=UPI003F7AA426
MTLGQYIRQLRTAKGYSQPDLAELMNVEQSYLSKLENDKSVPSNDMFRKLLTAFNLTLDECMQVLAKQGSVDTLKQIPDIEHWFKQQKQKFSRQYRQLLTVAIALVALGLSVFWSGYQQLFFSMTHHEYVSEGVLKEGEPVNLYQKWDRLLIPHDKSADRDFRNEMYKQMSLRKNSDFIISSEYLGEEFTREVAEGRRYYKYEGQRVFERVENAWLQFFGVLFLSSGVMLSFLAHRLIARQ